MFQLNITVSLPSMLQGARQLHLTCNKETQSLQRVSTLMQRSFGRQINKIHVTVHAYMVVNFNTSPLDDINYKF